MRNCLRCGCHKRVVHDLSSCAVGSMGLSCDADMAASECDIRHDMTRSPPAFLFLFPRECSGLPRYMRSRILTLQLGDARSLGRGGAVAIASATPKAPEDPGK